jgi:hypothetical protein
VAADGEVCPVRLARLLRAAPDQLSPAASIDVLSLPGQKAQITQQNIACGVMKSVLPKTVINTSFVYPSGTP